MSRIWLLSGGLASLAIACFAVAYFPSELPSTPVASPQAKPMLEFQTHSFPHSTVYTLTIPPKSGWVVKPAVTPGLRSLESFAKQYSAIAVLNGGFFDPINQQSTSDVQIEGKVVADPRSNERLIQNPDLTPYLIKILNRSEWRRSLCGSTIRYEISLHSTPLSASCQLLDSLGAGPQLLPTLTAEAEGFLATVNGEIIRDPIGIHQPNARSAIGLTSEGSVIWVMVAQKPDDPDGSGMSFTELTTFLKTLGVTQALNLDGGSSSALYYQGKTWYGKVDAEGQRIQRPVKSVLMVVPEVGDR